MAALAYVLLPLSGTIAFLTGSTPRMRFHGLQAIAFGFVWALAIYAASFVAALATLIAFILGAVVWMGLLVGAVLGRDPRLPGGSYLESIARSLGEESGRT